VRPRSLIPYGWDLRGSWRVGLSGIHFHDLRHAGNTLTADEGASLRELMDRMGHSSTRAALIYLHSSDERQRKLADAVGERARAALGIRERQLARKWHEAQVRYHETWRARQDSNPRPAA